MNCKITWMLGQEPLVFLLTEWLVGTFSYCRAAQLSPPVTEDEGEGGEKVDGFRGCPRCMV